MRCKVFAMNIFNNYTNGQSPQIFTLGGLRGILVHGFGLLFLTVSGMLVVKNQ